jgi:hypothetical protein
MNMIHRKIRTGRVISIFLLLFALALTSCLPLGPETIEDFDVIATLYNDQYNFQKNKYYAMPDDIWSIEGSGTSPELESLVLSQIETNMQAYGYTRVDTNSSNAPDVIITVAVTTGERNLYGNYSFYDYWGTWFSAYGYTDYDNSWNYNYPNYGSTDYYGLQFGTVLIHMADHENANPGNKSVPAEWIGIMNGLAEGSYSQKASRLISGINQIFSQSAYIKVN